MLIPSFTWAGGSWEGGLPMRAWVYLDQVEGGWARGASGVQASYVTREQEALRLRLRFYDWEWSDVRAMLRAGMRSLPLVWRPDKDDPSVEFTVYVDEPRPGTQADRAVEPSWDRQFGPLLTVDLVVRRTDGQDFDLQWWEDPSE